MWPLISLKSSSLWNSIRSWLSTIDSGLDNGKCGEISYYPVS